MDRLRIAMVAPPWYPIPPAGYGGIERVVHLLTRELLRHGHEITLFTCAGSDARLHALAMAGPGWDADLGTPRQRVREATYLRRVYARIQGGGFDLVHDHTECAGLALAALLSLPEPVVSTVHGPIGEVERELLHEVGAGAHLVAISESQRRGAPGLSWAGTVHNGVDFAAFPVEPVKDRYLLHLARLNPDKGQAEAIEIARRLDRPLVLAGKLDRDAASQEYFETRIRPHLGHDVTWLEEVAGGRRIELLARASALLAPLQWDEPFGLALVESMATGTPVLAFPRGAARELVDDGVTGFLAADVDGLVAAAARLGEIEPQRCRERAQARFGAERMAAGYQAVFASALAGAAHESGAGLEAAG